MTYQTSIYDYIPTTEEYIKLKRENEYLRNILKQREQLLKTFCKDLEHINQTLHYNIKYNKFNPY